MADGAIATRRCGSSARWRTPPSTRSRRPSPAAARSRRAAVEAFANREGLGVEGIVDGHAVVAGRPALLAEWSLHLQPGARRRPAAAEARGQTAIAAGWDGRAIAVFVVADTVKPTSAEAVASLRRSGCGPSC